MYIITDFSLCVKYELIFFVCFSVIHKGMDKQMAQNVRDAQIDRIQELAQAQGVSMRYLCELVGKRRRGFFADIRNWKDYTMQVWNIAYNKTLCKKAQAKPDGKDPPGWLFFGGLFCLGVFLAEVGFRVLEDLSDSGFFGCCAELFQGGNFGFSVRVGCEDVLCILVILRDIAGVVGEVFRIAKRDVLMADAYGRFNCFGEDGHIACFDGEGFELFDGCGRVFCLTVRHELVEHLEHCYLCRAGIGVIFAACLRKQAAGAAVKRRLSVVERFFGLQCLVIRVGFRFRCDVAASIVEAFCDVLAVNAVFGEAERCAEAFQRERVRRLRSVDGEKILLDGLDKAEAFQRVVDFHRRPA